MSRNILLLVVAGVIVLGLSVGSRPPEKDGDGFAWAMPDDSSFIPVKIHEASDIALMRVNGEDLLYKEKQDWSRNTRDFSLDAVGSEIVLPDQTRNLKRSKSAGGEDDKKAGNDYSRLFLEGSDRSGIDIKDKDWLTRDVMDLERKSTDAGALRTKNRSGGGGEAGLDGTPGSGARNGSYWNQLNADSFKAKKH